jgi:hypothetical protein
MQFMKRRHIDAAVLGLHGLLPVAAVLVPASGGAQFSVVNSGRAGDQGSGGSGRDPDDNVFVATAVARLGRRFW